MVMRFDALSFSRILVRLHIVILIIVFHVFCLSAACAQEDRSVMDLAPIIVSATRVISQKKHTVESITVYTDKDIDRLSARNLAEAVQYMSGVDVSISSMFGQPSALSIHGSDSRHVLVMIDGIPFNTQLSGQADPTIIPIEHVQRIEVIKGASSSAWGSNLGGVINVITKDTGDSDVPRGTVKSSFAGYSTTKNSFELAGKVAALGYFFAGSYLETDGIKSYSDAREKKLFGKLSVPLGEEAKITGSFGYSGAQVYDGIDDDTWYSLPYAARYGKLGLDIHRMGFDFAMAYKYNNQDIVGDAYTASTGDLSIASISHDIYHGISFKASRKFREDDVLAFGSDFDWHIFKSNIYLSSSERIHVEAPYINYTFKYGHWDIIPGLRYDHNQKFGSQASPSLGIIYHLMDAHQTVVRGKISRAFSAPPLAWLYNDNPSLYVGPNPDLKAERAMAYEASVSSMILPKLEAKIDMYYMDVTNALALTWDGANGVYIYDNFKKFRRQGLEASLNYKITDQWTLYGGGVFNDVKNRETGEIVRNADIARHSFSFGAQYKNDHGFGFYLYGYYKRWSAAPDQANDRKFIFNVKLTKEFKDVTKDIDLEIFLSIYNLTDSQYWSDPMYPLPERYVETGVSLKF